MLTLRKFKPEDAGTLEAFLKRLDLFTSAHPLDHFWVAVDEEEIVAALRLEKFDEFAFLSHMGVAAERRGRGIGAKLMDKALSDVDKPTYLYTIIPEYFARHGFHEASPRPDLPPRGRFGCDRCEPGKCVCMVKNP
jgi:N-acetylglutamate synthase-like GNAT family acetyltransferase